MDAMIEPRTSPGSPLASLMIPSNTLGSKVGLKGVSGMSGSMSSDTTSPFGDLRFGARLDSRLQNDNRSASVFATEEESAELSDDAAEAVDGVGDVGLSPLKKSSPSVWDSVVGFTASENWTRGLPCVDNVSDDVGVALSTETKETDVSAVVEATKEGRERARFRDARVWITILASCSSTIGIATTPLTPYTA